MITVARFYAMIAANWDIMRDTRNFKGRFYYTDSVGNRVKCSWGCIELLFIVSDNVAPSFTSSFTALMVKAGIINAFNRLEKG